MNKSFPMLKDCINDNIDLNFDAAALHSLVIKEAYNKIRCNTKNQYDELYSSITSFVDAANNIIDLGLHTLYAKLVRNIIQDELKILMLYNVKNLPVSCIDISLSNKFIQYKKDLPHDYMEQESLLHSQKHKNLKEFKIINDLRLDHEIKGVAGILCSATAMASMTGALMPIMTVACAGFSFLQLYERKRLAQKLNIDSFRSEVLKLNLEKIDALNNKLNTNYRTTIEELRQILPSEDIINLQITHRCFNQVLADLERKIAIAHPSRDD